MIKILLFIFCVLCLFAGEAQSDQERLLLQLDSLVIKSWTLADETDFVHALEINSEVERVGLEKFGRLSKIYANACFNHGRIFDLQGEYAMAEVWYLEAKDIQEKVVGKNHADYAKTINNLALMYGDLGRFDDAEPLYMESKGIFENSLGKDNLDYAKSISNLAKLYSDFARYEASERYYKEAKDVVVRNFGKSHIAYVIISMNLGILYAIKGEYEKAEILLAESAKLQMELMGRDNTEFATSLANLGLLNFEMGRFEIAEKEFLEGKEICERILGSDHPLNTSFLANLANLYSETGDYKHAKTLIEESMSIDKRVYGEVHPIYATDLNNLAVLYVNIGQPEKAKPLYKQVTEIREVTLGKDHPEYASSLINLAAAAGDLGEFDSAMQYLSQAIEIRKRVLGVNHPIYAQSIFGKASLYNQMGRPEEAAKFYTESAQLIREKVLSASRYLSERELNQYILTLEQTQSEMLGFAQLHPGLEEIFRSCYDNVLFYKGYLLYAHNQQRNLILADSVTNEKSNLLKSFQRMLASQYSVPLAERAGMEELEQLANELEKEIARTLASNGQLLQQANWNDIKLKLKGDEAALEFVNFHPDKMSKQGSYYAAMLIRASSDSPEFIPLFEESALNVLLNQGNGLKLENSLKDQDVASRGIVIANGTAKVLYNSSLYEMLWKPLEKHLAGISTIYFSSAGLLNRINLDAIPVSSKRILSDQYHLIQMNSTRQLAFLPAICSMNNEAVLFGGIKYESVNSHTGKIVEEALPDIQNDLTRGGNWNYLPGTEDEVKLLMKTMTKAGIEATLKMGHDASEDFFKRIGADGHDSPRIIHLATHGYFFPDPKLKADEILYSEEVESVFKMSDHPMLRSGLIVAGGNISWNGAKTLEGTDDGILTAYEISQMNLSNTELVVLSACETGLGEIQGNEGVYGLQRAFKIAGAKYLIMSLWQVPDKQTSMLMTTFYKKWLEEKMSIPDAFHAAQKGLRVAGLDPYQWAGFVLVE